MSLGELSGKLVPNFSLSLPYHHLTEFDQLSIFSHKSSANNSITRFVSMFCNSQRKQLELIWWETNGFWIAQKTLEKGRWSWPDTVEQAKEIKLDDVFVDLGRMFLEDFTEAYDQEFDRQCLIADDDPFTGAMNAEHVETHATASASINDLTYEDFRAAELKVEPEERKFCKWFMNETVLNHITNIKDDNNNPIWRKPWEGMPGRLDGYDVIESRLLPQFADIEANTPFAIFMNPKRIIHGNRKGIEIKRFDENTEGLEYGELFMRFRKRDGFLVTRPKKNMVLLKTKNA